MAVGIPPATLLQGNTRLCGRQGESALGRLSRRPGLLDLSQRPPSTHVGLGSRDTIEAANLLWISITSAIPLTLSLRLPLSRTPPFGFNFGFSRPNYTSAC